jgi:hypothetical protein
VHWCSDIIISFFSSSEKKLGFSEHNARDGAGKNPLTDSFFEQ